MKKIFVLLLSFMALWSVFAGWATTPPVDAKMVNSERVPPIQSNGVSYTFDQTGTKTLLTKTSSLLQVTCNASALLKTLGFGDSASSKILSLGIQEGSYEYTFDIRNCSLWWNKANATYTYTKSLTEKQALAFADSFMKTSYLKDKIFTQVGAPIIISRNNGNMYPMVKWAISSQSPSVDVFSGIEVDTSDPQDVSPEYTSFSIMYPYVINGQEVYEQYGNRAGISLDISAEWVNSVNARLLPFKGIKRNSEKLTGDDAIRILKNGGNSPFWGQTKELTLAAPQRVLVLFNLWRDNKNYLYLSSGIGLKSNVKTDQYAQQNYTMVLSDYKIGNTAQ